MSLYFAVGFSALGALGLFGYFSGGGQNMTSLILGILCIALGSYHGKKYQDDRNK